MAVKKVFQDVHIVTNGNAGAIIKGLHIGSNPGQTTKTHTTTELFLEDQSRIIAPWGTNNDFPKQVQDAVEKVGVAAAGLSFNADSHYGRGLMIFKNEFQDNKEVVIQQDPNEFPDVKEFFKANKVFKYMRETIQDFEYFKLGYTEMLVSNNFEKILSIQPLETAFSRLEVMDENNVINNLYHSAYWREGVDGNDRRVTKIDLINPWLSAEEIREHLQSRGIKKFVYPILKPSPGRSYYPFNPFYATMNNGWMDVAANVARFKKALMENQLTIVFHIEIPDNYFECKYQKWGDYSDEKRDEIRRETLKAINDTLAGVDNAGKAIATYFGVDDQGKPLPSWKITVIDNKFKEGAYIPDSQTANSEILFSMMVDPTLFGSSFPGSSGGAGAGSGSDKREAFTIRTSLKTPDRQLVVEPLEFIRDFNKWDEDLRFGFKDFTLTTLDKNPTAAQTTTQA